MLLCVGLTTAMCLETTTPSTDNVSTTYSDYTTSSNRQQLIQHSLQQQQHCPLHQPQSSVMSNDIDDMSLNFPPPPPAHVFGPASGLGANPAAANNAVGRFYDSDDDFPLPPPPDVCNSVMTSGPPPGGVAHALPPMSQAPPQVGVPLRPFETKHAGLMQSLSMKLATRNSVGSVRPPPPVAAKSYKQSLGDRPMSLPSTAVAGALGTLEAGGTVGTQEAEAAGDSNGLLSLIQRGKSLRRTVSNDRSAPHLPGGKN